MSITPSVKHPIVNGPNVANTSQVYLRLDYNIGPPDNELPKRLRRKRGREIRKMRREIGRIPIRELIPGWDEMVKELKINDHEQRIPTITQP